MLKLFKKAESKKRILKEHDSFVVFLKDLKFIADNTKKLDTFEGTLFLRHRLNVLLFSSNSKTSIADISDIEEYRSQNPNMYGVSIFTNTDEIQIDFSMYSHHVIYEDSMVVFLSNQTTRKITF